MFDVALYNTEFFITVGIIILLIQSDYYLTLIGYSLYKKYYAEYYKIETYELNPIWRKSVEEGKKFNIRHLLLSILLIILYAYTLQMGQELPTLMTGLIVFPFVIVNLFHLYNIRLFRHFKTRKTDIKGHMEVSLIFGLKNALLMYTNYAILLLLISLIEQSLFLFGGVLGVSAFILIYYLQYRRMIRKENISQLNNQK